MPTPTVKGSHGAPATQPKQHTALICSEAGGLVRRGLAFRDTDLKRLTFDVLAPRMQHAGNMRGGTFAVIYLLGFLFLKVVHTIHAGQYRSKSAVSRRSSHVGMVLLGLLAVGMLLMPLAYIFTPYLSAADYSPPPWVGWIGSGIFAVALWLFYRSSADLGRNFSPVPEIKEAHILVTEGIYRYLRHPMYTAEWLWGIAQALLLHNWLAGPGFLVFFAMLYWHRVGSEEQLLIEHFGDAYRDYMGKTGRLLPRLRRTTESRPT